MCSAEARSPGNVPVCVEGSGDHHTFLHVGGQFNQHGRVWHVGIGGRQVLWGGRLCTVGPLPLDAGSCLGCAGKGCQTLLGGSVTASGANWSLACKDALVFHIILERKYFKVITT